MGKCLTHGLHSLGWSSRSWYGQNQSHDQPTHLETKDTQAKVESRPQPESRPETPQESVTEQSPVTHAPEARGDTSLSKTDHVEPSTPVESNTNLIQEVSSPSDQEQVFATAQKEINLSALSRDAEDTDPVETPAGPILVAMAEQPVLVTPGAMQQNLLNPHNQIVPTEQEDGLQQK